MHNFPKATRFLQATRFFGFRVEVLVLEFQMEGITYALFRLKFVLHSICIFIVSLIIIIELTHDPPSTRDVNVA